MKVRCNNCMEVFEEEEVKEFNSDYYAEGSEVESEKCPSCGFAGALMDLEEENE